MLCEMMMMWCVMMMWVLVVVCVIVRGGSWKREDKVCGWLMVVMWFV